MECSRSLLGLASLRVVQVFYSLVQLLSVLPMVTSGVIKFLTIIVEFLPHLFEPLLPQRKIIIPVLQRRTDNKHNVRRDSLPHCVSERLDRIQDGSGEDFFLK